ncbi:hypothetical protein Hdeb2414_s0008g00283471 [Helianthus debilis subsp. tardiflorus]
MNSRTPTLPPFRTCPITGAISGDHSAFRPNDQRETAGASDDDGGTVGGGGRGAPAELRCTG